MKKILLTGGSGDLGMALSHKFNRYSYDVINLDLQPAPYPAGEMFVQGSITNPNDLNNAFKGVDAVVHIAGLHGVHLAQGAAPEQAFRDVNIDGTCNVFQTATDAGVRHIVHISTSSVHQETPDIYGHSKIEAENVAAKMARDHNLNLVILRPRAFIPPWNEKAYSNPATRFKDWSNWFLKGSVHLQDVTQAVEKSLLCLDQGVFYNGKPIQSGSTYCFDIDGTYNYDQQDIDDLKALGFKRLPQNHPEDWRQYAEEYLGYMPSYGIKEFVTDWKQYAPSAPPNPYKP